jgi:hypothetical protein
MICSFMKVGLSLQVVTLLLLSLSSSIMCFRGQWALFRLRPHGHTDLSEK